VDLDAYVAAHAREWERLGDLLRIRRRTGDEADELITLYQRAATHLSVVRSSAPDPVLVGQLSRLVARGRAAVTGSSDPAWRDATRFLTATLPAALYRGRAWWGSVLLGSVAVSFALGAWVAANPDVQTRLVPREELDSLVHTDFRTYYSTYAHGSFAAQVWTHNAWIVALCIALGVLGLPVLYLLWQNVANVAVIGGIMVSHGRAGLFFGLILPHGMLELTAVFVAAGTGLRLFWSWVAPGPRPRAQALAEEGRAAMSVVLGLVGVLAVSGFIEGFVTPSGLPTGVKVGIGLVAEAAFLTYVFVLGGRATRAGITGDVSPEEAGDLVPVRG
jgi:uncharacterized membrane protein SpoIIM required for sporulation